MQRYEKASGRGKIGKSLVTFSLLFGQAVCIETAFGKYVKKPLKLNIYATREGREGEQTANGHIVQPRDHFVALPSRKALCSNGGREFEVRVTYQDRSTVAPVWDVGPWNTKDDYWNFSSEREMWKDLPWGMPEAQAAYQNNYNNGKDQFGRKVVKPAGIDLADGTFWDDLGMIDNDWVAVEFLWIDAESGSSAAYRISDLGKLREGWFSRGTNNWGINGKGQVLGEKEGEEGNPQVFIWIQGEVVILGTLGGDWSLAGAINDSGQAVGTSALVPGSIWNTAASSHHAFLWQDGRITDLGTLGGKWSKAWDINEQGQIVGFSEMTNGQIHSFLWQNGRMSDLGVIGELEESWNWVSAINNLGQIVGASNMRAYLWENGKMSDIGTLGGLWAQAWDINDCGQIVGASAFIATNLVDSHAFVWENGQMIDLGTIGGNSSQAFGINNYSQIVGSSIVEADSDIEHAFIWDKETLTMKDLNAFIPSDAGWILTEALEINQEGQIIGYGVFRGEDHAFLLTPASAHQETANRCPLIVKPAPLVVSPVNFGCAQFTGVLELGIFSTLFLLVVSSKHGSKK